MPYHEEQPTELRAIGYSKAEYAVFGLAALGTAFMTYLTYLHFHKGGGSALCDFGGSFSCQIVNQSVFSEIVGIPVSILGMTYFLGAAGLIMFRVKNAWRIIQLFTVFSLVFSAYLSGIEYLWLGVICLFCELSKVLMLVMLGIASAASVRTNQPVTARHHAAAAMFGLLFTGFAFLLQR